MELRGPSDSLCNSRQLNISNILTVAKSKSHTSYCSTIPSRKVEQKHTKANWTLDIFTNIRKFNVHISARNKKISIYLHKLDRKNNLIWDEHASRHANFSLQLVPLTCL